MDRSCKASQQWKLPLVTVRNTFVELDERDKSSPSSTRSDPLGRVSRPAPVPIQLPESWKHGKKSEMQDTEALAVEDATLACPSATEENQRCSDVVENCTKDMCSGVTCEENFSKHAQGGSLQTQRVTKVSRGPSKAMCATTTMERKRGAALHISTKSAKTEDRKNRSQNARMESSKQLSNRSSETVSLIVDVPDPFANDWPVIGAAPWFGNMHAFHCDAQSSGRVSADFREFTKCAFEGRLTLLSERSLVYSGVQWYLVMFTRGYLSVADGVGFVFSHYLPCPKNIQKITSIFVNQRGHVCLRVHSEVVRFQIRTKPLEIGDLIGLRMDMEAHQACFVVWPAEGGPPAHAIINFGTYQQTKHGGRFSKDMPGHFACVVKNAGVSLRIMS